MTYDQLPKFRVKDGIHQIKDFRGRKVLHTRSPHEKGNAAINEAYLEYLEQLEREGHEVWVWAQNTYGMSIVEKPETIRSVGERYLCGFIKDYGPFFLVKNGSLPNTSINDALPPLVHHG